MTGSTFPLFRPDVQRISGYVPGEQPQEAGWVKLNTNENPYPPSPLVVEALERTARGRLNVYPDPLGTPFRRAAAELFDLEPDWFLPANGSDENLTILFRAFVDPGELVSFPYPSYILYETLADIQGARHERLQLRPDWSWDHAAIAGTVANSKLLLVPNPNSPSGNRWGRDDLLALCPPRGLLVIDEAYADFAVPPYGVDLLKTESASPIVVTRTLSKSYSLAGLRFGFAIAHPDLIGGMRKVKDSYNCDALSLAAATAALQDQTWMQSNRDKIRATRSRLSEALSALHFHVVPSEANFVWVTHPDRQHRTIYEQLKARRILVRYMQFPGTSRDNGTIDGLRMTVGTDAEIDTLLEALRAIV